MQEKDVGILKGDINMEEKIVKVLNVMSEYLSIAQMKNYRKSFYKRLQKMKQRKQRLQMINFWKCFLMQKL